MQRQLEINDKTALERLSKLELDQAANEKKYEKAQIEADKLRKEK